MVYHFQEQNKVKSIKEPLEVNLNNMENNKPIEPAQSLIEQDMLCYILFSEDLWPTTVLSSLNILDLILSWMTMVFVEVLLA